MHEITLNATIRKGRGRSSSNRSRRQGIVPGVYYLHNSENIPIEVRALDLRPLVYTSDTHVVELKLDDGSSRKAIVRDVQFDPVTDSVIHFDLMGLVAGEEITVEVPIVLEGSAIGVREGGILNHILHKIEIQCLPTNLPEHISVDISEMKTGDIIHVGDLKAENVTFLMDPDNPVVTISHARTETVAAPIEGEQPTEPELIGRKSEEE